MTEFQCRSCGTPLATSFCDLGTSPASNSFIEPDHANHAEPFYSLNVYVCEECFLVQLPEHKSADEIFTGSYAYFSSYSSSWLEHSRKYCAMMRDRFALNKESKVIELASNDGYLLQYFKEMGIGVTGIEPSANVADVATQKGIKTIVEFFGADLAGRLVSEGRSADVILGNNVLAHVPDINDFVTGMKRLLKPDGVITMEFPHLLNLIDKVQFDTIYHEHFSYLSLLSTDRIFARQGLSIFDVEELPTHGGSIRVFACHQEAESAVQGDRVKALLEREVAMGLNSLEGYAGFDERVREVKNGLLSFLIEKKREGKTIVGYGAAAKGNTLLNYCGIRTDYIDYVVDRSTAKQGKLLPGTRIPVKAPEEIMKTKPDYVLILPWNLRDEIVSDMAEIRDWGGQFVIPLPTVQVI